MKNIYLITITAIISIFLGFFTFNRNEFYFLYGNSIYYFISLIFFMWVYYSINILNTLGIKKIKNFISFHKIALITSIVIIILYFFICPPEYRILSDETNLLSTSKALYENNNAFWNAEAIGIFEDKQPLSIDIDKRLIAYPYFLNILHSLKGYSPINSFILNALVSMGSLFLLYYLIQRLWGRFCGIIAMLLLSSYPVFVQYSMSAGYDVFNLFFALLSFAVFCKFYENKSIQYADLLIYTVALFSYSRYECSIMAIFVIPITLLLLDKKELKTIKNEFILYPLLFIPVAWLISNTSDNAFLQLSENEKAFSIKYFIDNFYKALYFFSGYDSELDTVFLIAVMALLSIFIILYRLLAYKRYYLIKLIEYKYHIITIVFFLSIVALSKISYNKYGDFTFIITTRLSIIFLPYIIFLSAYLIKTIIAYSHKNKLIITLITFFIILTSWPKAQKNFLIKSDNTYKYLKVTMNFLENNYKNIDKNNYIIVSNRANYFVPFNYNSIFFKTFNDNYSNIVKQIKDNKNWKEIIVIQLIVNDKIFVHTTLNSDIKLEPIYEKAIDDNIYIRFSRVISLF